MTIRADMAAACATETTNFETKCGGRVRLTQEHLDAAANLHEVLAEARLGCSQGCGCQHARAWVHGGPDGIHVVIQCAPAPGEFELGHRDAPEPDGAR